MEESGDMELFLLKIGTISNQIRDGEGQNSLSDNAIISAILTGLFVSYKQWVYSKSTNANITLAEIEKELRAISSFEREKLKLDTQDSIFHTQAQGTDQKKKYIPKPITCFNCGKKGHIARNCKLPKKSSYNQFTKKNSENLKANANLTQNSDQDDVIFIIETNSSSSSNLVWIVDSSSTVHMWCQRKLC